MPLPLIGVAIAAGLAASLPALIARVLIALGISVAAFTGLDLLLDHVDAQISSILSGLTADAYNVFLYAGGLQAINIWLTALSALVALKASTAVFRWATS